MAASEAFDKAREVRLGLNRTSQWSHRRTYGITFDSNKPLAFTQVTLCRSQLSFNQRTSRLPDQLRQMMAVFMVRIGPMGDSYLIVQLLSENREGTATKDHPLFRITDLVSNFSPRQSFYLHYGI